MPVKQIIVTLENVPGKLSEVSDYLERMESTLLLSVLLTLQMSVQSGSLPIIRIKRSMF